MKEKEKERDDDAGDRPGLPEEKLEGQALEARESELRALVRIYYMTTKVSDAGRAGLDSQTGQQRRDLRQEFR